MLIPAKQNALDDKTAVNPYCLPEALRIFYCTANINLGVVEMATNLAKYIKQERVKQGLNYAELSRLMGYKNINRGMRRTIDLEREGNVHSEILRKIICALQLDEDIVNELILKDRETYKAEYERWLNEPVRMTYTIRVMPAVYLNYDLPSNTTNEEEAIEYVSFIAREKRKLCWLNLSRKIMVFINELGEVTGMYKRDASDNIMPYMLVR